MLKKRLNERVCLKIQNMLKQMDDKIGILHTQKGFSYETDLQNFRNMKEIPAFVQSTE